MKRFDSGTLIPGSTWHTEADNEADNEAGSRMALDALARLVG